MGSDVFQHTHGIPEGMVLKANGKILEKSPRRLSWMIPTPAGASVAMIRRRLADDGYVWLKRFFDPAIVLAFRGRVFSYLAPSGLISPGSDPRLGLAAVEAPKKDIADKKLSALGRSAAFEGFCTPNRLTFFMDELLGGLSYLHKRRNLQYTRPGSGVVTPAHYDQVFLRGGTGNLVTAWIPIGDVPSSMGGLCYLEGSQVLGKSLEADFERQAQNLPPQDRAGAYNKHMSEGGWISKDLPELAERINRKWLIADYEAGDVVLHSPHMIHASTENLDPKRRIRLSADITFQNVEDEVDMRHNHHWAIDDSL